MNIKSYLAQPYPSRLAELHQAIAALRNCEVIPADNRDVLVVITETKNKVEEEELMQQLESISSLKLLTLVSGFNSEQIDTP